LFIAIVYFQTNNFQEIILHNNITSIVTYLKMNLYVKFNSLQNNFFIYGPFILKNIAARLRKTVIQIIIDSNEIKEFF